MADILCTNCGMPNPDDQNICSFCRQPLQAAGNGESIRPGDVPTKKTTAELEPILPEWLRDAREKARRADEEINAQEVETPTPQPAPRESSVADWLAGLEAASREDGQEETPEWMRGVPAAPAKPKFEKTEETFPRRQEIHWDDESSEAEMGGLAKPVSASGMGNDENLPLWMSGAQKNRGDEKEETAEGLADQKAAPQENQEVSPFSGGTFAPSTGELTNWLDKAVPASVTGEKTPAGEGADSLNDWLSNLPRDEVSVTPTASDGTPGENVDLPDWMKPVEEPSATPKEAISEASLPDWMTSYGAEEKTGEMPAPKGESVPEIQNVPAFIPGGETDQADELFPAEIPDWLSNIEPVEQKPAATTASQEEAITPVELPSWVQAMRPVETALPGVEATLPISEGQLEEQGPLAGLRGVLPAAGGLIPSGKPKAHSIRLQTTEGQQASASLLEQILTAETQAHPISSVSMPASQRVLRWIITGVLLLLIVFILFTPAQMIPLPIALPAESALVLPVMDALPEGAPVLLVFDYEPALAGELESAAAPFVDRLIGLRHPRFTILSTSPTGAALAERFMSTTQSRHNYLYGQNYINLGFLPGGGSGILFFSQNPKVAMPLDAKGNLVWNLAVVQGVNNFPDYAAIILLTDQAEDARVWVEQTTGRRNDRSLVVISSAQAAPMIQPYLISGQINGMISGLHGGAAFEGAYGSNTPVRFYWGAYNVALLAVVLLIIFGSLWNLVAGIRSRRQSLDEV